MADEGVSISSGIKGVVSDVAGMVLVRRNSEQTRSGPTNTCLVTLPIGFSLYRARMENCGPT